MADFLQRVVGIHADAKAHAYDALLAYWLRDQSTSVRREYNSRLSGGGRGALGGVDLQRPQYSLLRFATAGMTYCRESEKA
ncbi:MAG: hypothetical protein ABSD08_16900 [Xanthobacteraceae bacterium]